MRVRAAVLLLAGGGLCNWLRAALGAGFKRLTLFEPRFVGGLVAQWVKGVLRAVKRRGRGGRLVRFALRKWGPGLKPVWVSRSYGGRFPALTWRGWYGKTRSIAYRDRYKYIGPSNLLYRFLYGLCRLR